MVLGGVVWWCLVVGVMKRRKKEKKSDEYRTEVVTEVVVGAHAISCAVSELLLDG